MARCAAAERPARRRVAYDAQRAVANSRTRRLHRHERRTKKPRGECHRQRAPLSEPDEPERFRLRAQRAARKNAMSTSPLPSRRHRHVMSPKRSSATTACRRPRLPPAAPRVGVVVVRGCRLRNVLLPQPRNKRAITASRDKARGEGSMRSVRREVAWQVCAVTHARVRIVVRRNEWEEKNAQRKAEQNARCG